MPYARSVSLTLLLAIWRLNLSGDLVFLSAFGKNVLFVNTFEAANELFEKRSSNYSDRAQSIMSHELWVYIALSIKLLTIYQNGLGL